MATEVTCKKLQERRNWRHRNFTKGGFSFIIYICQILRFLMILSNIIFYCQKTKWVYGLTVRELRKR